MPKKYEQRMRYMGKKKTGDRAATPRKAGQSNRTKKVRSK